MRERAGAQPRPAAHARAWTGQGQVHCLVVCPGTQPDEDGGAGAAAHRLGHRCVRRCGSADLRACAPGSMRRKAMVSDLQRSKPTYPPHCGYLTRAANPPPWLAQGSRPPSENRKTLRLSGAIVAASWDVRSLLLTVPFGLLYLPSRVLGRLLWRTRLQRQVDRGLDMALTAASAEPPRLWRVK